MVSVILFNRIEEGSSAEQYEDTFFWLPDSMIANECRRATDPNVGLSLTESDSYIKCYLGDTGLLVSHAFDENELLENEVYKQILAGKLGINEGMLYENAIAQMLAANGHRLFFYTHYNTEKSATILRSTLSSQTTAKQDIKDIRCTQSKLNPANGIPRNHYCGSGRSIRAELEGATLSTREISSSRMGLPVFHRI